MQAPLLQASHRSCCLRYHGLQCSSKWCTRVFLFIYYGHDALMHSFTFVTLYTHLHADNGCLLPQRINLTTHLLRLPTTLRLYLQIPMQEAYSQQPIKVPSQVSVAWHMVQPAMLEASESDLWMTGMMILVLGSMDGATPLHILEASLALAMVLNSGHLQQVLVRVIEVVLSEKGIRAVRMSSRRVRSTAKV